MSSESQATRALCSAAQASASVVFPEPAGAEISVSGHASSKRLVRRDRATIGWCKAGGRSFVFGIDGDCISKV